MLHKLSQKALVALAEDFSKRYKKLYDLVEIANSFDMRGCFDAADQIDNLIQRKVDKLNDPGRHMALTIRQKRNQ